MKHRSKRPATIQLQAIQTSRHLHTVHPAHTGHVTPHHTTSYPALAMILMVVGVFIAGWTHFVTADSTATQDGSYLVQVSVPGPPPSQPATVEVPNFSAVFTLQPVTVKGSCPMNTYEVLYRNGAFSGVGLCSVVGHYAITTSLFPGVNQLQVRDFSQTDVAGPFSGTVMVHYNPPSPPVPPSTSDAGSNPSTTNSSGPAVNGEPLIFKTTFTYEGHYVGNTTTWELDIEGGTAPYAIAVDWGDGNHSLLSQAHAGSFTVDHVYNHAGGYRGSYVSKFTASDSSNSQTFLQLLAIVNDPPNPTLGGGSTGTSQQTTGSSTPSNIATKSATGSTNVHGFALVAMKYVWPTYGIAVMLLLSFWLGERREYERLRPRLKKARHA